MMKGEKFQASHRDDISNFSMASHDSILHQVTRRAWHALGYTFPQIQLLNAGLQSLKWVENTLAVNCAVNALLKWLCQKWKKKCITSFWQIVTDEWQLAESAGMSTEHMCNILHEYLDMNKLCARKVLRLLMLDQKVLKNISSDCLELFWHNPEEFLCRFVTIDKTWITGTFLPALVYYFYINIIDMFLKRFHTSDIMLQFFYM